MVLADNSFPIEGKAITTEELINGTRNAPIMEINSTIRLSTIFSKKSPLQCIFLTEYFEVSQLPIKHLSIISIEYLFSYLS
jgi:hypothetical protein